MKHGSLFSGIGGFDLAAQWMGWENTFHCEIEDYQRKILKKHFPNAKTYSDIRKFDATIYKGNIDIITGGFPCQDISTSQTQKKITKGIRGERSGLWSEYKRIIKETNCRYIVAENTYNLLNSGLEQILFDLAELGYNAEWSDFSAKWFGYPHERRRVYIVAYSQCQRWEVGLLNKVKEKAIKLYNKAPNQTYVCSKIKEFERSGNSDDIRINNGLPFASHRIKSLGNAIIPQIAFEIFKAIEQCH